MRKLALILLLFFQGSASGIYGEEAKVSIGAYYYPWYDADGRHWSDGYHGKGSGQMPALGEYSSRSKKTIERHITWSEKLGIDHWICSWWGPHSWEDKTLRDYILPELNQAEKATPKFCILYETAGLLGLDPEHGIDFDNRSNTRKFAEDFAYLARNYFDHPGYQRIDGKPVVYLYLTRTFTGDYAAAITRARAVAKAQRFELYLVGDEVYWGEPDRKRIAQFDAITSYNMHGPEHFAELSDWSTFVLESEHVYQSYRETAQTLGVGFIPGILPGFDSRDAGRDHYPIPRRLRPGSDDLSTLAAFYAMSIRQLDPRLKTVAITSFNEWHEGTQLEPKSADPPPVSLKKLRQ